MPLLCITSIIPATDTSGLIWPLIAQGSWMLDMSLRQMSIDNASRHLQVLRRHFSGMDREDDGVVVFAFQFCRHMLCLSVSKAAKRGNA